MLTRVYLVGAHQLVCEAVNVLLHREGIELLGMEMDSQAALAQVRALDPEVVLVEGDAENDERLMPALAGLVCEKENLRVIRISLTDKELRIYRQEQRRLVDVHDLVAAISTPKCGE